MKDRRKEKTQRGIEQYKAFYAPFLHEEIEALISFWISKGEGRKEAEYELSLFISNSSWGFGHRDMLEAGIKCRICNDPADSHAYGRPYCHQHVERAVYGKIGKVYGGFVAA